MSQEPGRGEPKIYDKGTTKNSWWAWGLKESRILPGLGSNGDQKKSKLVGVRGLTISTP